MDDYLSSDLAPARVEEARRVEPERPLPPPERFSEPVARRVLWGLVVLLVLGCVWFGESLLDVVSESGWRGRSDQVAGILPGLATIFFAVIGLATRAYHGETRGLWIFSYLISLVFLAEMLAVWIALVHEPHTPAPEEIVILTPQQRDDFMRGQIREAETHAGWETPLFVRTGIFVKATEFKTTENVTKSGYLWQTYVDGVHEGLSREFLLAEAVDTRIRQAYRRRRGNVERIGWYFEAETREVFDYHRFPFDVKDPRVRIWHKDFDRNVILLPDLESYVSLEPTTLPGLEDDFVLPGFRIERSFFSYKLHRYNTTFGIDGYHVQGAVPELYFTLIAKREFVSSFFLLILPVLVMLVLIFVIVYNMPPLRLGGEGLYNIARICGTYIFILILNHVNLRQQVSGGIVYLEYFYVILYFGILWTLLNAALYLKGLNPPGIRWRENLIARLAFLPLLIGGMFLATVLTFRH